jgi:DNA-binding Lrp family transcriptional regulator
MKQSDPDNPILTKNDQEVLRKIVNQAKMPDAEIARQLNLSQQAIFKIREKLENKGIIEGYTPIINFKKIGIKVMVVLAIRIKSVVWNELSEDQISQRLREMPQVVNAFRVPESTITHLLILGFSNINQKDQVLMRIQNKFCDEIEIVNVYPFSVDRIITMSPIGLLNELFDQKERAFDGLFLKK